MSRALPFLKSSSDLALKSQRRCLNSLNSKRNFLDGSVGKDFAARRYAATAAESLQSGTRQRRVEYLDDEEVDGSTPHRTRCTSGTARIPYPKLRPKADPQPLVEHLQKLFPPLLFPDTVATQMLTHISAKEAWSGHNGRLAFVGRRVLQSYLLLFLHSASQQLSRTTSPPVDPDTFNFDLIAYRALHTSLLGEFVGVHWDLARTMLWTPAVKAKTNTPLTRHYSEDALNVQETPASLKSPGLYKVQGTAVEGIMGGIFHQFGGTIAQRVFHTRLLPHILCPGTPFGLHDAFHHATLEMQSRMGGPDGLLVPDSPQYRSNEAHQRHYSEELPHRWDTSRSTAEPVHVPKKRILS